MGLVDLTQLIIDCRWKHNILNKEEYESFINLLQELEQSIFRLEGLEK